MMENYLADGKNIMKKPLSFYQPTMQIPDTTSGFDISNSLLIENEVFPGFRKPGDAFGDKPLMQNLYDTQKFSQSVEPLKAQKAEEDIRRNQFRGNMLMALGDALRGKDISSGFLQRQQSFQQQAEKRIAEAEAAQKQQRYNDIYNSATPEQRRMMDAYSAGVPKGVIESQFNQPSDSSTSAIDNLQHLNNLYEKLNSATDKNEKESIQRQINDFEGILGTKKYDVDFEARKAEAIEKAKQGGVSVTPLQKKIDEAFSLKAVEFESGGKAQVEGNIANLQNVIGILKDGNNVSGPFIGLLPEGVQSFTNPKALAILGNIRDIVFQSLREKLGAQFTEKEGDRLVAAAYDQRLSEEENIKRLERLLKITQDAAIAKQNMVNYYGENGTLAGYESTPLTFNSLMDSFIAPDLANKSDDEIRAMFKNGDKDTRQAILRYVEKNKGE